MLFWIFFHWKWYPKNRTNFQEETIVNYLLSFGYIHSLQTFPLVFLQAVFRKERFPATLIVFVNRISKSSKVHLITAQLLLQNKKEIAVVQRLTSAWGQKTFANCFGDRRWSRVFLILWRFDQNSFFWGSYVKNATQFSIKANRSLQNFTCFL